MKQSHRPAQWAFSSEDLAYSLIIGAGAFFIVLAPAGRTCGAFGAIEIPMLLLLWPPAWLYGLPFIAISAVSVIGAIKFPRYSEYLGIVALLVVATAIGSWGWCIGHPVSGICIDV